MATVSVKHQPASPLPWSTGQMPARWPEGDQMYAAFAANAYPKLVERTQRRMAWLASVARALPEGACRAMYEEAFGAEVASDDALLRELGEAE